MTDAKPDVGALVAGLREGARIARSCDGNDEFYDQSADALLAQQAEIARLTKENARLAEAEQRAERADKDADAAMIYGKTCMAHGYTNAPQWSELHDDTRQIYRDKIAARSAT